MYFRNLSCAAFVADFPSDAHKFIQRTFRVRLINLCTSDKKSSHKIRHKETPRVHLFEKEVEAIQSYCLTWIFLSLFIACLPAGTSWDPLYENYEDISSVSLLGDEGNGICGAEPEELCRFDDRTLILEDTIDNGFEYQVYRLYYDLVSADFEHRLSLIGENESFRIAVENEETLFKEGRYMEEYVIHEISALGKEALEDIPEAWKKELLDRIRTYKLQKYVIVKLDVSWKHTEASLQAGPQLGDGRYIRYYLLGSSDTPEFKIYEVYWEGL